MEPVPLPGTPFSHYYSQEASDEGIIMETDIAVKEVGEVLIVYSHDSVICCKNIMPDTVYCLTYTSESGVAYAIT
jgi:hypothetical protein